MIPNCNHKETENFWTGECGIEHGESRVCWKQRMRLFLCSMMDFIEHKNASYFLTPYFVPRPFPVVWTAPFSESEETSLITLSLEKPVLEESSLKESSRFSERAAMIVCSAFESGSFAEMTGRMT